VCLTFERCTPSGLMAMKVRSKLVPGKPDLGTEVIEDF
jgi:hypothetical protein